MICEAISVVASPRQNTKGMSSTALFGYDPDTGEAWEEGWWREHLGAYLANPLVKKNPKLQDAYKNEEVVVKSKNFTRDVLEPMRERWKIYQFFKWMRHKIDAAEKLSDEQAEEFKLRMRIAKQFELNEPGVMTELADDLKLMYESHLRFTREGFQDDPEAARKWNDEVMLAARKFDEDDFNIWNFLFEKAALLEKKQSLARAYIAFVVEARRMALYFTEQRTLRKMRESLIYNSSKAHVAYWLHRLEGMRLRREFARDEQVLRCTDCGRPRKDYFRV